MNKRQEDFCYYYATTGNGYESAIKAGYSDKSAKQQASRLLTNANLKRKIESIRKESLEELKIESKDVIRELSKIAFANIGDFVEISEYGELVLKPNSNIDGLQSISATLSKNGKSFSIKLHDKLSALKELAKVTGVYDSKLEEKDRTNSMDTILESIRKFTKT